MSLCHLSHGMGGIHFPSSRRQTQSGGCFYRQSEALALGGIAVPTSTICRTRGCVRGSHSLDNSERPRPCTERKRNPRNSSWGPAPSLQPCKALRVPRCPQGQKQPSWLHYAPPTSQRHRLTSCKGVVLSPRFGGICHASIAIWNRWENHYFH